MLKLKNVSKFYYSKGVIASGFTKLNLELKLGEFVAITGESGSGKSTLLNVISGLDTYEEGELYINGEETSHYTEKDFESYRRKYISNIFQSFNLINSYTVYQNVELVLLLNGYKKRQIKKKVIELIDKVGLSKFKNTKVSKLSGGQKQRVAIARALAKETPIIVADEPTGNLDSEAAKDVIQLLSEIAKDKLVIVVTHNYEQIEQYVTRKIKMHDGRIIEDKRIKEVETIIEKKNETTYKDIRFLSNLRLGIRNTFNIKVKFLLLFAVFLFVTTAIISEYTALKKAEHLSEISGENYFFDSTDERRIIIKKKDKTAFNDEEFANIQNIENVDYIVKNDLLLDSHVALTNDNDANQIYLYGKPYSLNNFSGKIDEGNMPQNDDEIIIETDKEEKYYGMIDGKVQEISLLGQELYLIDNNTGEKNNDIKLKVVGIKYKENNENNLYYESNSKIYCNEKVIDKLKFQINQFYSTINILFENKYYKSNDYSSTFTIIPNSNVPQGKIYVNNDLNYYCKDGKATGKNLKIEIDNLYYEDSIELVIEKTYTKNNFEKLTGLKDYDQYQYNGAIFVNVDDYNSLYNKSTYQSSVFIKNMDKLNETKQELENMELSVLPIKETLINDGLTEILRILKMILTLGLIIALLFISYFIIRIILKSRNIYFSTLRMLGASRKVSKRLLIIELFTVVNITYIVFMIVAFLSYKGTINLSFTNDVIKYLKLSDYIITYVILVGMSYIISLKYSKKLFKNSSIKTYNEEV